MSDLKKKLSAFLLTEGYEIKSFDRLILAFGPTITDDYTLIIGPVKTNPPALGIHIQDGIGAKSRLGG